MSTTPQTDAAVELARPVGHDSMPRIREYVPVEVARQLERENAALRKDKERLDKLEAIAWHGGTITSPLMNGARFRIYVRTNPVFGNTIRDTIDAALKEIEL